MNSVRISRPKFRHQEDCSNEIRTVSPPPTSLVFVGRKWRKRTALRGTGEWCIEVGEPINARKQLEIDGLQENIQNPAFYRLDTPTAFQWKVRNAPPPLDNYRVTVDSESRQIVIKTENKKFYKTFSIPDLDRCSFSYDSKKLLIKHQLNTLIIQYEKPSEILCMEENLRRELRKLKSHEGPSECEQS